MRTRKGLLCLLVSILSLTAPGLQPGAEARNCTVDVLEIHVASSGKLQARVRTSTGAEIPWAFCNFVSGGAYISAETCSAYYSMALTARALGAPLRLVMDDSRLSDAVAERGVSWDGTCEGIVNWTDLEPAVTRIDLMPS